jgi:hypothetical protein
MRKLIATATAGLALTAGSIGLAVAGPLSGAFAQTAPSTPTTTAPAPDAGTGTAKAAHPRLRAALGKGIKDAAGVIGITPKDLLQAYRDGQSVAEVAQAHGVDPQTVIDKLVADADSKIDQALTNGTITQDQADKAKAKLPDRVTKLVNRHKGDARGSGDGKGTGQATGTK